MRQQALEAIRKKYKDQTVVIEMAQALGLDDLLAPKEHESSSSR